MPDLGAFSRYKSLTDYLNENEERKAKMAQQERLAGGGSLPAALQMTRRAMELKAIMDDPNATREQQLEAAYESQKLTEFTKILPHGMLGDAAQRFDVYGNPEPSPQTTAQPAALPAPQPTSPMGSPSPQQPELPAASSLPPAIPATPPIPGLMFDDTPPAPTLATPVPKAARSGGTSVPGFMSFTEGEANIKKTGELKAEREWKPVTEGAVEKEKSRAKYLEEGKQGLVKMRRTLDSARITNDIMTAKANRVISLANGLTTGFGGALIKAIPGQPAHTLKVQLGTLLAETGFAQLMEMRNASATGGALGNVTELELKYLQDSVTAMEQSLTKEEFLNNMNEYLRRRMSVMQLLEQDYKEGFARFNGQEDPYLRGPEVGTPLPSQQTLKTPVPSSGGSMPTVNSAEERDKLAPGTLYIGPDGQQRRKK